MKLTIHLIGIFLFTLTANLLSQNKCFNDRIFGQDSSIVNNRKFWFDLSIGPSITLNPRGLNLFLFGPTLGFTYINHNYRLVKIKTSFHHGIAIFENPPQYTGELGFMTGKIKTESKHTIEFYYGLAVIMGRKRDGIISSSDGGTRGFSVSMPWTEYKKKDFVFIGIPFEYKIQWSLIGLGIDGNINPYLPYLGTKLYLKTGNNYRK